MGLKNFIERQLGIGKLPNSQLNENTIINLFQAGVPFIVSLPIYDTVRINAGSSISKSMGGGYSQRVYSPGVSEKRQRRINTIINCTFEELTIRHAQSNGKHIFIKINHIYAAGMDKDSVVIELNNGLRYLFSMNNEIKNQWKKIGFKPQSVINVFYRVVNGTYQKMLMKQQDIQIRQQKLKQLNNTQKQNLSENRSAHTEKIKKNQISSPTSYNLKIPCPVCGKLIKAKALRCKYCKTMLKEYKNKPEYQKKLREEIIESKKANKGFKVCPNCNKEIPKNAIRCKYCKTMLK